MKLAGVDIGLDSGHSLSVFFETPANAAGFIWSGENGVNTPSEMSLPVSNSIVLEDEKYFSTILFSSPGGSAGS